MIVRRVFPASVLCSDSDRDEVLVEKRTLRLDKHQVRFMLD